MSIHGRLDSRLLAALLAGVALATVAGCGSASHTGALATKGWKWYTGPAGWSLSYPTSVRVERSDSNLRLDVSEVTVASFRQRPAIHV